MVETRSQRRRREIRDPGPNRGGIEGLRESYRQAQRVYQESISAIDYEKRFRRNTVLPTRRFGFSEDMTVERLHELLEANELDKLMEKAFVYLYDPDSYINISVQNVGFPQNEMTYRDIMKVQEIINQIQNDSHSIIMKNENNQYSRHDVKLSEYNSNGSEYELIFQTTTSSFVCKNIGELVVHMIIQCFCEHNLNSSNVIRIPKLDKILCVKNGENDTIIYMGYFSNSGDPLAANLLIDYGGLATKLYDHQQRDSIEIKKAVYLCLYQFANLMIQLEAYFHLTMGFAFVENIIKSHQDDTYFTLGYADTFRDSQIEVDGLVFKSSSTGFIIPFVPNQNILELVCSFIVDTPNGTLVKIEPVVHELEGMVQGTVYQDFLYRFTYEPQHGGGNANGEDVFESNMWQLSEFSLDEDTKNELLENPDRITNNFVKEFAKQRLREIQHEIIESRNARDVSNAVVVSRQAGLPSDIARQIGGYLFGKRK